MTKYLVLGLLLTTLTGSSVRGSESGVPFTAADVVKVGLDLNDSAAPSPDAATDEAKPCASVSFSRNLKYGESDQNVLDVATRDSRDSSPRPVLLFVAGESFTGDSGVPDAAMIEDEAMCFAARHGMVGVKVNYRLAPAKPWPAGAQDVAGAPSWRHQIIGLFGGSRDEIVSVGYVVGAFHVASFLAHPELQASDSGVAG